MSDSATLVVVAPNARLGREITACGFAQPIQLRSFTGLRKKPTEHPTAFLLLEWESTDGETPIQTLSVSNRIIPHSDLRCSVPIFPNKRLPKPKRFGLCSSKAEQPP